METNKNDNKYIKAKQKVAKMKKFYSSLMFYFIFIAMLGGLNYYTNQWDYPWFLWAAFGWGIGLIFKALDVFNWNPFVGKDWEERKLKQFMEEEERKDDSTRF
jgi:hypothetical protein